MARLLIRLKTNPDPLGYQRGDVVCLIPDGHDWGRVTVAPDFMRIELQGVSDADVRKYLVPDETDIGKRESDGSPILNVNKRRKWNILVDEMTVRLKNMINVRDNSGKISVNSPHLIIGATGDETWLEQRRYFQDTVTGRTEEANNRSF